MPSAQIRQHQRRTKTSSRCVALFTKPATPGEVKTRLIGRLTPAQAADLHGAFLRDLSQRLARGEFDLRIAWALESGALPPDSEIAALVQEGNELGERLYRALSHLSRSYPLVAAVGSDHPELPLSRVHNAFDRLEADADVVLGPAHDGGYYLIAVRREALKRALFTGIEWSGPSVLEATLKRCRNLGLRTELLEAAFDVDTPEDLDRLDARLSLDPGIECPQTRALLDDWRKGGRNEDS
ncbi:MAG: TIGR04282 family arsenosugar biosynthesis glycosyltransferase [Acidobacteriota bacterium]